MTSVDVVVVTFNSESEIGPCLDALADRGVHVIVVDNASTDRTVEAIRRHSSVTLIANGRNLGFAGGVNQAVQAAEGDVILLLNPDAIVLTDLAPMIEGCRRAGLAAGKLVDSNGRAQRGFSLRRFPTPWTLIFEVLGINSLLPWNPVNLRYRYIDRDSELPGEVEQPAGAFLCFRRDVWRQAGGFDESFYPVWFEDADFCARTRRLGFAIQYFPNVVARHAGGHSVNRMSSECRKVFWYVSLLRYAAKHFRAGYYKAVCAAVVLASLPRMVVGVILERNVAPVKAFSRVILYAVSCLFSAPRGMGAADGAKPAGASV